QLLGYRVIVASIGPVGGEDFVRLAAEQEIERRRHGLAHGLTHPLVPVVHRPAAVLEAARGVLFGAARCLHDAIEGQKCGNCKCSHAALLWLSVASLVHRAAWMTAGRCMMPWSSCHKWEPYLVSSFKKYGDAAIVELNWVPPLCQRCQQREEQTYVAMVFAAADCRLRTNLEL